MIGQEKAFHIMEKAISEAKADEMEMVLMGHNHFLTRFANSQIHQNTAEENGTLFIKVAVGKKIGVSTVNHFHPQTVAKAVEDAITAAKFQKEIPDYSGLPENVDYTAVSAWFPRTFSINPEEKALIIQDMIARTGDSGISLSGGFYTGASELAVFNTSGLRKYFISTGAELSVVATGDNTSGYGSISSRNVDDINHQAIIDEALESAKTYGEAITLEPGSYPVILEEYAVAEMLEYLSEMAFTSESAEEGSSFVIPHKGEQMFSENIGIYDDAVDPATFMVPFDYEGVPKKRLDFVKNGVVTGNVTHNTYTANKEGKKSTGHALPPSSGLSATSPFHTIMDAGSDSKDDLLKKMGDGLIVKRFHYLTTVHPLKTIISGMTRDGVFRVENGKITARVKNLRFTNSVVEALKKTKGISKERKLIWFRDSTLDYPITAVAPEIFVDGFNFTGNTEF